MPFSDVLDQPRAVSALRRALGAERVAHAYLLHGPEGVGKRALALAFAQALLCEAGGDDGCGACGACHKVRRLIHPDLHVVFALPSDADEDDVSARLARLVEEPYASAAIAKKKDDGAGKQAFHSIERMQEEVRRPLSFRPLEGRFKIALLLDVELMRPEAANAFLKLLEEPSAHTVFLLTTSRLDRVLPTVLSRCQQVRLDPLDDGVVAQALQARTALSDGESAVVARMAGGSFSRALDLAADPDLGAQRDLVLRFFRYAFTRKPEQLPVLDEVAALPRDAFKRFCDLGLRFAHDLVRYRTLGATATLANADQQASIVGFVTHLPNANLDAVAGAIEEARGLVERNVSGALVARSLAARLGEAMLHGSSRPLFEPLAA